MPPKLVKHSCGCYHNSWAMTEESEICDYCFTEKKLHFCPDWDYMLISKQSPEFESCLCFRDKERMPPEPKRSSISVELTDESEAHCLKLVFQARNVDQPLEIFLHTTQAIHLVYELSLAICELHRRDSEMLLKHKYGLDTPLLVDPK